MAVSPCGIPKINKPDKVVFTSLETGIISTSGIKAADARLNTIIAAARINLGFGTSDCSFLFITELDFCTVDKQASQFIPEITTKHNKTG